MLRAKKQLQLAFSFCRRGLCALINHSSHLRSACIAIIGWCMVCGLRWPLCSPFAGAAAERAWGTWPLITLVVVMGPISFWGNVVPRAFQRIGGTILGSALGLVALKLELISLPLMVLWCAAACSSAAGWRWARNPIRRC